MLPASANPAPNSPMTRVGHVFGAIVVAIAALVACVVVVAWFVQRPHGAQPLAARHADLFGRAEVTRESGYSWDGRLPGTIGPMTLRIGERVVSVPAGTAV